MRRLIAVLTLILAVLIVTPTEAQGRFWVLVNGALRYTGPVTIAGNLTTTGTITSGSASTILGGNFQSNNTFFVTSKSVWQSPADGVWQGTNFAGTTGIEINMSAASLGTCTAGTITTGSRSQAGGYTGNTSGSCIVNFGTNWTNAPFCVAMSIASTTHPRVSATAVGSITITGGVSGEAITYLCMGRV